MGLFGGGRGRSCAVDGAPAGRCGPLRRRIVPLEDNEIKMSMKLFAYALLACVVISLSGCYQLNVRNGAGSGSPVERRQHLFALGFFGDPDIDVKRECPSGVATVDTRFSAEDVLLTIASVGIYSPRTVLVDCGPEARG